MTKTDLSVPGTGTSAPAAVSAPEGVADQVLRRAREVFVCDGASLLSGTEQGRPEVLAATDPQSRAADLLQVSCGEGPALRTGDVTEVQHSGNAQTDPRWPRWGAELAELGWSSVLTAPLVTADHGLGMLTLYARRRWAFDATHAYAARVFAAQASTALGGVQETTGLRDAIRARQRLALARGIVMEQHGIDADAAFDLLRRYAEDHGVKLRSVAESVVDSGSFPPPTPPTSPTSPGLRVRRRFVA
jgi:transcriptional regulator with GAF, ATPase, and Fis domain